eukprot:jgi/Ulvmu1/5935/UM026_0057.1
MDHGKACQRALAEHLRSALACMVMDLKHEEEKQSNLRKALAEAQEAEQKSVAMANRAQTGEQRAMLELDHLIEAQTVLTDRLEGLTEQLGMKELQNRQLLSALSVAQKESADKACLLVECDTKLRHELSTALSQQQKLVDQLAELDTQLAASKKTSLAQTVVEVQQENAIEQLKNELALKKGELQHAEALLTDKASVCCISRACSPACPEVYEIDGCQDLAMPGLRSHTTTVQFRVSDARTMLEQLGRQLNAALLENLAVHQQQNQMWERIAQLEGKNAALLDTVARMRASISLEDLLASNTVGMTSGRMPPGTTSRVSEMQSIAGQGSSGAHHTPAAFDVSPSNKTACTADSGRPLFHWSGVDVSHVARQRDHALQEAIALSAELQCARRQLLLTSSALQMSRAAEEAAAQARCQVSDLSVHCTCLMCILEGTAAELQSVSSCLTIELSQGEHQGGACARVQDAVQAVQGLFAALEADIEGVKGSFTPRTIHQHIRVGSQERARIYGQMSVQSTQFQHVIKSAARARSAARSVLERVLAASACQALWARAAFLAWRGLAERRALAVCAQRAEYLEDWAAQARDANCERLSMWVLRTSEKQHKKNLQWLLHTWNHATKAKKAARNRWVSLLHVAGAHNCEQPRNSRKVTVARRRTLQAGIWSIARQTSFNCAQAAAPVRLCFMCWWAEALVTRAKKDATADIEVAETAMRHLCDQVLVFRAWSMWRRALLPKAAINVQEQDIVTAGSRSELLCGQVMDALPASLHDPLESEAHKISQACTAQQAGTSEVPDGEIGSTATKISDWQSGCRLATSALQTGTEMKACDMDVLACSQSNDKQTHQRDCSMGRHVSWTAQEAHASDTNTVQPTHQFELTSTVSVSPRQDGHGEATHSQANANAFCAACVATMPSDADELLPAELQQDICPARCTNPALNGDLSSSPTLPTRDSHRTHPIYCHRPAVRKQDASSHQQQQAVRLLSQTAAAREAKCSMPPWRPSGKAVRSPISSSASITHPEVPIKQGSTARSKLKREAIGTPVLSVGRSNPSATRAFRHESAADECEFINICAGACISGSRSGGVRSLSPSWRPLEHPGCALCQGGSQHVASPELAPSKVAPRPRPVTGSHLQSEAPDGQSNGGPARKVGKSGTASEGGHPIAQNKHPSAPSQRNRGKRISKTALVDTMHISNNTAGNMSDTQRTKAPVKCRWTTPLELSRRAAHMRHRLIGEHASAAIDTADPDCDSGCSAVDHRAAGDSALPEDDAGTAQNSVLDSQLQPNPDKMILEAVDAGSVYATMRSSPLVLAVNFGSVANQNCSGDTNRGTSNTEAQIGSGDANKTLCVGSKHTRLMSTTKIWPITDATHNLSSVSLQPLLASTMAAVDLAQKQVLAVSDMHHRIVQGSVPGLMNTTAASGREMVPFIAFQAGDLVCPGISASPRSTSPTIASQLKQDVPHKVCLNTVAKLEI